MTTMSDVVTLGSREESRRLWAGALRAYDGASDSLVFLCEALDLGIRAAEIQFSRMLYPIRGEFPATIESLLAEPDMEVDVERDAIQVPNTLRFSDLLDMLSDRALSCVSPKLHRGWEDRLASCGRSRIKAQSVMEISLSDEVRHRLLLLLAYRNRVFRMRPPVKIVIPEILDAYPALIELMEGLRKSDTG